MMRTIRVELGERGYPIHIGPTSRTMLQKCNAGDSAATRWAVIADQTAADLHWQRLKKELPEGAALLTFQPGEDSKSLATASDLYARLAAAKIERSAVIVTFGGGVAGDLGGFVAATWLRGVRQIQVPTTLLAAVDASVGGKTAVNLPVGKNLVGVFYQPAAVIIDTDFLQTIPDRELISGLAESVKHAAIRAPDFLAWHEASVDAIRGRRPEAISELVARNCEIKAAVVAQDEREADVRAILNYGHTLGHAIEHLLAYELRHGECVALGLLAENEIACARGLLPRATADRIRLVLDRLGLPLRLPAALDAASVCAISQLDKKVRDGAVNFVLLRDLGQPLRVADVTEAEIAAALAVIQPA